MSYIDPYPSSSGSSTRKSEAPRQLWWTRFYLEFDRRLLLGFTPAFFTSVMGTGISCNILYAFPYNAHWLRVCGLIMAVVALVLFLFLLACFCAALSRRNGLWTKIHKDPAFAPPLGTLVMGYITLVNILHAITGTSWIIAVWVLWWISVAGSLYTSFVTFYMCAVAKHSSRRNFMEPASISMVLVLPVVTLTVAASLGNLVAPDLPRADLKIITMIVSFVMWAIAVLLAFIVVTVNFWKLFVYKIPATDQVFTMFLPIGFLGQGAYAVLLFGRNCVTLIMENANHVSLSEYTSWLHSSAAENGVDMTGLLSLLATAILTVCTFMALMLISFGYFFTFVAVASLFSKMAPFSSKPNAKHIFRSEGPLRPLSGFIRFNRGFWSMTFPLGTMALSNGAMHTLFNGMKAFRVISVIYAVALFIITLGCLLGVAYRVVKIAMGAIAPTPTKEMV